MAEEAVGIGEAGRVSQLKLVCGVTLDLTPVKTAPIRHLLLKMGGADLLENPERLRDLDTKSKVKAAEAFERLLTYLTGWGVKNDPPLEAIDELNELDMASSSKQVMRANWIRFFLMEDDTEAAAIVAAVLALSIGHVFKGTETK